MSNTDSDTSDTNAPASAPKGRKPRKLRIKLTDKPPKAQQPHYSKTLSGDRLDDYLFRERSRDKARGKNEYTRMADLSPDGKAKQQRRNREKQRARRQRAAAAKRALPTADRQSPGPSSNVSQPSASQTASPTLRSPPSVTPAPPTLCPTAAATPSPATDALETETTGTPLSTPAFEPARTPSISRTSSRGSSAPSSQKFEVARRVELYRRRRWREAQLLGTIAKKNKIIRILRQQLARRRTSTETLHEPETEAAGCEPSSSHNMAQLASSSSALVTPAKRARQVLEEEDLSPSQVPKLTEHLVTQHLISGAVTKETKKSTVGKQEVARIVMGSEARERSMVKAVARELSINPKTAYKYASQDHSHPLKPPHGLETSSETKKMVQEFYLRADNSRMTSGVKDKRKVDGEVHQIRLLCDYMKILHSKYLSEYPNHPVSYSTFRIIKPRYVIPPRASDRQTCLCVHHENLQLMIDSLLSAGVVNKHDPEEFARSILCTDPGIDCWLRKCTDCNDPDPVGKLVDLDSMTIPLDLDASVSWYVWKDELYVCATDDGSTTKKKKVKKMESGRLETLLTEACDLLDKSLCRHIYTTSAQFAAVKVLRADSPIGTLMVQLDFAENYACRTNREIQSAYFAHGQVTIHPFMLWYYGGQDQPVKYPFVVVSDTRNHTTIEVHAFQRMLFQHLSTQVPFPKPLRVVYLSDGCAGQYKNFKNMVNLTWHNDDFGMSAEWHFFATSHGKGACDGLGAAVKRAATHITDHMQGDIQSANFFEKLVAERVNMPIVLCSEATITRLIPVLKERWSNFKPYKGSMELHRCKPEGSTKGTLLGWPTSCCNIRCVQGGICESCEVSAKTVNLTVGGKHTAIPPPFSVSVGQFWAAVYDNDWFVGQVSEVGENESKMVFMKWSRKEAARLIYAEKPEEETCWIPSSDLLTAVAEPTPAVHGRYFNMDQKDMERAAERFRSRAA